MTVPPSEPQPYPEPYPYQYPQYPQFPPRYSPRTNAMAIASLVCGFLFAPLAIVFGHISLSQIKRSGEDGRGLAIAGLVIGYIVTIGTIVALVAGVVFLSWAARVIRDSSDPGGAGIPRQRPASPPLNGDKLPSFTPPAGLGATCAYPPTATPAVRPVRPPRSGAVPTDPAIVDATMLTNDGAIGLRLDNGKSPCTVNSFVSLAQQGYFDNTDCHRLTDSAKLAVVQCGDPTGTGSGGPGYRFANEYPTNQYRPLDPALERPLTYPRGTLAMAAAGKDSNGSQFLIVYRDSKLPPTYTVFGRVDDAGLATLDKLAQVGIADGGEDGKPQSPITIESIRLD